MDVNSNHTKQLKVDGLWKIKQDAFFRISEQVGNIHVDEKIPPMMKNISLYLENKVGDIFLKTKFSGIYRTSSYNIMIKEYVKFDNNNWVIYIDTYNIPEFKDNKVVDLNIENSFAEIDKFVIGCVDGQIMLAPSKSERVISLTDNFITKKLKIDIEELRNFMLTKDKRNGYTTDTYKENVYLIDSPSPLFGNDTVMYRDSNFVGMWISFGTLLKFDLKNLNVFNIDGVKVGAIDLESLSPQINALKLLSNSAYGYASILFNKKTLLGSIMRYSRKYVYEKNMEDGTRICVDNLLKTVQEKGILGLLYEEFTVLGNYPLMVYNEDTVSVSKKLGNILKFSYKNEYIYMLLDVKSNKMYFMSYAGRIEDYTNSKFEYNVKIMNDMWLTKTNDVNGEGFVLFTGFPNLQHNKVIDIYFDKTVDSFSSLDKNFTIDVNDFDGFYYDNISKPMENSYKKNIDLIHAYGNNPFPLVSGLLSYAPSRKKGYLQLETIAEPMISTVVDPKNKSAFLMVPSIKTNSMKEEDMTPLRVKGFISSYLQRWEKDKSSVSKWIDEAEAGSYLYQITMAYYSNGWTLLKTDDDTYTCLKLNPVKVEYVYSGAIEQACLKASKSIISFMKNISSSLSKKERDKQLSKKIASEIAGVTSKIQTQYRSIKTTFVQEIMYKSNSVVSVADFRTPRFEFNRFLDSKNQFINNEPTGPILNHSILFEDTFKVVFEKMRKEYFGNLGLDNIDVEAYCPYITNMNFHKSDNVTHLNVKSDISNSIEVLKNDTIGVGVFGDTITKDAKITIGDTKLTIDEAYGKSFNILYLGIKKLDGTDMNIYKITVTTKMTDTAKKAYFKKFSDFNNMISKKSSFDFNKVKDAVFKKNKINDDSMELDLPETPSSQPLYIANFDSKLMVSLDNENYMNAPLGGDGIEISSRIKIYDKSLFLSELRNLINSQVNKTSFSLFYTGAHNTDDIYSVGVRDVWINHKNIIEDGKVNVIAKLFVDNGQIVLQDDKNLIYSEGDEFIVEREVDIKGFIDNSNDKIKVLVNFSAIYYTNIPCSNAKYDTAQELLIQDDAYKVTLGLPIALSIPRGDYIFVDKSEATSKGVDGWFNFTELGA